MEILISKAYGYGENKTSADRTVFADLGRIKRDEVNGR